MDSSTIAEFLNLIEEKLKDISLKDDLCEEAQRTVELDQQTVGRLSRMDALQVQAMAQAQQPRCDKERTVLSFALKRISESEFGYCDDCGQPIEEARFRLNPAFTNCISGVRG